MPNEKKDRFKQRLGVCADQGNEFHNKGRGPGENQILVKADNTAVPADRWYSGAGIYRKVYLLVLPKEHLDTREVQVIADAEGTKGILTVHSGIKRPVRLLLKRGGFQAAEASPDGNFLIEVPDCELWSAAHPALYELKLELLNEKGQAEDSISLKAGFLRTELSARKGLYINSPICDWAARAGRPGRSCPCSYVRILPFPIFAASEHEETKFRQRGKIQWEALY